MLSQTAALWIINNNQGDKNTLKILRSHWRKLFHTSVHGGRVYAAVHRKNVERWSVRWYSSLYDTPEPTHTRDLITRITQFTLPCAKSVISISSEAHTQEIVRITKQASGVLWAQIRGAGRLGRLEVFPARLVRAGAEGGRSCRRLALIKTGGSEKWVTNHHVIGAADRTCHYCS